MACCDRILVDNLYIGEMYERHERDGAHGWAYDGEVCCREKATRWHQYCECGAGRWVDGPTQTLTVDGFRSVTPDEWPVMARNWVRA